jgi:hypothetical protein
MLKTVLAALILSALVPGCAKWTSSELLNPPPLDCHPTPPQADVTVSNGVVDVQPDALCLADNSPIIFTLRTDGYTFPATGAITFDRDPLPRPGEFDCRSEPPSGPMAFRRVKCDNKHSNPSSDPKRYKYTVHVLKGSTPLQKDPFIVNR